MLYFKAKFLWVISMYLWLKAFHIIAMVAWFAGLFYLPRLYVYHVKAMDEVSLSRFKIMEYRLYYAIMWPAALLTTVLGISLISLNASYYLKAPWMHAKLAAACLLWAFHLACGHYRKLFSQGKNLKSERFFRVFNELPTILLVAMVILAVLKPL